MLLIEQTFYRVGAVLLVVGGTDHHATGCVFAPLFTTTHSTYWDDGVGPNDLCSRRALKPQMGTHNYYCIYFA